MPTCPAGHQSQASDYCDTCGRVIGGATAAPVSAPDRAPAPGAGVRPGCPECGAGRDGRFCEECGYDFELAEAMPELAQHVGFDPVETQGSNAAMSMGTAVAGSNPGVQAPGSAASTVPAESAAEVSSGSGTDADTPGLDLDAELARAESEASASSPDAVVPPANAPDPSAEQRPGLGASPYAVASPGQEISLVVDADRDYYDAQVERGDIVGSEFPFPKYPAERRFSFAVGPVRIGRASASRGLSPEIDLTGPPLDPAVSHLHAQLIQHGEGWVVVDLGSANGTRLNDTAEPLEAETEIPVKSGDRIHLGVWTTIVVQ